MSKNSDWNRNEFIVYLLLYCANMDTLISDPEVRYIQAKTDMITYNKIVDEFNLDSDFERIEKIKACRSNFGSDVDEQNQYIKMINDLFKCDGQFDSTEEHASLLLKKILF